ncbi:DUF2905 domain-containing protein [Pradoshia sp. D12]|uniref:DUF2905 domain-containing protein n=1 Tax=Bacillaceae TaxID=186817 RepID=UPI00080AF265|nr:MULTISPECIES: DUF2905 domain-containing protein [Bacillaceae]OCA86523.1 hypothetical protein A8L44_08980 [Bacillus sp. FJAT-27986]QFK72324.1 DUF2905 domain-containing protein [Pradoshia sp. D12]TPF71183.1 DUF2905 domain-containing protein [Bacillus sp. D12]
MNHLPKTIMMIGVAIFVVGFLMQFIKIGRLPGDILLKKGNTTFYFPIMTSIIVSILLSVFFYIISRFK